MILGSSPDEVRDLILSVGTGLSNRPLTPMEVAKCFQRALDEGQSKKDIAEACLLDGTSMLPRFTKLLELSEKLHSLVRFGSESASLSFTQATEIAKLKSFDQQEELALLVIENNIPKKEIISIRQLLERSDKPLKDAVADILKSRPKVETITMLGGSVTDVELREKLTSFTQLQRDEILSIALENLKLPSKGHLDVDKFILFTTPGSDIGMSLDSLEDKICTELNRYLYD